MVAYQQKLKRRNYYSWGHFYHPFGGGVFVKFGLYRHFWSYGTAQSTQKMLLLGLMVCIATLSASTSTAIGSEAQQRDTLQPQGLNYAGIYALRELDPNLTGAGVKFAIISRSITYINGEPQNDYRPNTEHNCFANKQINFHDQGKLPAGISAHSTAICSILLGEDPNAFNTTLGKFHYQGVAPKAQVDVYEFWHFLIDNVFPHSPPDADIATAGIGNQLEDWWTRGIESLAEHYGLIVVAGIGNGTNAYAPVLYPGAGANVIGVGVVDSVNTDSLQTNLAHFSLAYPKHSSLGPTADGRCKPDIVAPGNCLAADVNEPNRYEPTGNWSSFSTPTVAGTIGLLIQKAKEDPNLTDALSPQSGNCVIKAILMNSATKLPYWHKGRLEKDDDHSAPLDYIQGAGLLNAVEAYKHLIARVNKSGEILRTGWDLNHLRKSENSGHIANIYKIIIEEPNDKFITTTVVWNKHYDRVYPFESIPEKDANLRLELRAVDPNNPDNNYLLDYSDSSVDNVEHIYCRADANYTNYEIVVSYSNTDELSKTPTTHRYGLAWNVSKEQVKESIFCYDLNADGIVNELDFTIMFNNLLTSTKTSDSYLLGDINTDGVIDVNDLQILLKHINLEADWYTESKPE